MSDPTVGMAANEQISYILTLNKRQRIEICIYCWVSSTSEKYLVRPAAVT